MMNIYCFNSMHSIFVISKLLRKENSGFKKEQMRNIRIVAKEAGVS